MRGRYNLMAVLAVLVRGGVPISTGAGAEDGESDNVDDFFGEADGDGGAPAGFEESGAAGGGGDGESSAAGSSSSSSSSASSSSSSSSASSSSSSSSADCPSNSLFGGACTCGGSCMRE